MVFMQPQRLVVPLFQRPYVWNEESQWEPLWNDVERLTERVLSRPTDKHYPHFLGAVVLQQVPKQTGHMQERTIIDGQQRLTTLQLLMHALQAELMSVQALLPAKRIEPLVTNDKAFCSKPEDRFKVWPTNRDRRAFNAVLSAGPPVNYDAVGHRGERMLEAHRYFSQQAREWLARDGTDAARRRAEAIETVARELIQMVVIDLSADENAQEIFETLNARGVQLSAADLIKNFVFQRLLEDMKDPADVEEAYESDWKEFESGFWEAKISVGRLRYPRSAIFLNHWLIARTGEEVVAREVFARFKTFANRDAGVPMKKLLRQVHVAAGVYRDFIMKASTLNGDSDRLGIFGYRTGVLESEVIKPLVLCLLDPEETPIPQDQRDKALDVVESWMVRRMLVGATTKNYNQVVTELVKLLRKPERAKAGDLIETYLAGQSSVSRYWPDDAELRQEVTGLLAYRRLSRGRLRMVLESIEDHQRGWRNGKAGLGGERVPRGKLAIEHVMPRKWQSYWPLNGNGSEVDRDRLIHTLGNLTLLTGKLNSKVSNGPWLGAGSKREGLQAHDVLMLNRAMLRRAGEQWTDEAIRARTQELADIIIQIWPVPAGHRSGFTNEKAIIRKPVSLSDLMVGGALQAGMSLFPRRKRFSHQVATLLQNGELEVNGKQFSGPSDAASAIAGRRMSGWWFFLTDQLSRRSLRDVRRDYLDAMALDEQDEDPDEDEDDDEEG
jgi:hypothetical protein